MAARYSLELGGGTLQHEVLQQLEDLRLAEWSDRAPPPPAVPTTTAAASSTAIEKQRILQFHSHLGPRNYVNYPSANEQQQSFEANSGGGGGGEHFAPFRQQQQLGLFPAASASPLGGVAARGGISAAGQEPIYVPGAYQVNDLL